jgi:TetR/AcrR family transcriptional regulator
MDTYTGKLRALLDEGVVEGAFRPDLDTEEAARLIVALVQGLVMRWSISDFEFPLEAQGDALWRFLEPALAARWTP